MATASINKLAFRLEFNVIVTFRIAEHVFEAIEDQSEITGYPDGVVGGSQVMYDLIISIYTTSQYDHIMRRVKRAVVNDMHNWFGIAEDDICKISTAADWRFWEQLTGRDYNASRTDSQVSHDGKFILPAFYYP